MRPTGAGCRWASSCWLEETEDDRAVELVAVARHRRQVDAGVEQQLRELAPPVGAEVEEEGAVAGLDPGPSAEAPYKSCAEALPATLDEALAALRRNACFRAGFGDGFVDYYAKIKEAEIARCRKDDQFDQVAGGPDVSEWEHREYFDSL